MRDTNYGTVYSRDPKHQPPSDAECMGAVVIMGRLIRYFPADIETRELIALSLKDFVRTAGELRWLAHIAANVMAEWNGLAELRGLYCTRFPPKDGISAVSSLPGYTPREIFERSEQEFFAEEMRQGEQRLAEYKREFLQLPPAEREANRKLLAEIPALAERKHA